MNLKDSDFVEGGADQNSESVDSSSRMKMSIKFARSCVDLGHELVCYPEKVKMLCEIFDGVDGCSAEVWPTLESDPFIPKPEHVQKFIASLLAEMRHPSSFYEGYNSDQAADYLANSASDSLRQDESGRNAVSRHESHTVETPLDVSARENPAQEEKKSKEGDKTLRGEEVNKFSVEQLSKSLGLFSASIPTVESSLGGMPTTNILALCAKQVCDGLLFEAAMQPEKREILLEAAERFGHIRLTRDHWVVRRFVDQDGKDWYQALFVDSLIPLRNKPYRESPRWARYLRPWVLEEATLCIPPHYRDFVSKQAEVYEADETKMKALLFESIEMALRMEAAFFLERHFWTARTHWYEQPFYDLIQQLSRRILPISQILPNLANA